MNKRVHIKTTWNAEKQQHGQNFSNFSIRKVSYAWIYDEVELLLKVRIKYKFNKAQESVDWESSHGMYYNILIDFHQQFPSKTRKR